MWEKNMIISTDTEKAFNNTLSWKKNTQQTRNRTEFLQPDKGHLWITIANIIFKWKIESLLPKIKNKTKMSTLATFIQHALEDLGRTKRQEKERKHIQKEEARLFLFVDDINLYLENSKEITKNTIKTNKQVQQGCRTRYQCIRISCISKH